MQKRNKIAVIVNSVDYGIQIVRAMRKVSNEEFKIITPLNNLAGYKFDGWIDIHGVLLSHSDFRDELLSRMKQEDK